MNFESGDWVIIHRKNDPNFGKLAQVYGSSPDTCRVLFIAGVNSSVYAQADLMDGSGRYTLVLQKADEWGCNLRTAEHILMLEEKAALD